MNAPDFKGSIGTSRNANEDGASLNRLYIFMRSLSPDYGASFNILAIAILKLRFIFSPFSKLETWVSI